MLDERNNCAVGTAAATDKSSLTETLGFSRVAT